MFSYIREHLSKRVGIDGLTFWPVVRGKHVAEEIKGGYDLSVQFSFKNAGVASNDGAEESGDASDDS